MKKKELQELAVKTVDELVKLAHDLRHEIGGLAMDLKLGKVKNLNEVRTKQKNRARILTLIHAKTKGGERT